MPTGMTKTKQMKLNIKCLMLYDYYLLVISYKCLNENKKINENYIGKYIFLLLTLLRL